MEIPENMLYLIYQTFFPPKFSLIHTNFKFELLLNTRLNPCCHCPVGHAVLSINGVDVVGKNTADGKDILEYLKDPSSYPVSIRFGRARLSSNEKLMLASMFHS